MQLAIRDEPCAVLQGQRSSRIGKKVHLKAQMKCLAGGRVTAHLRHVAADSDLLDARSRQARWPVPATMRLGSSVSSLG